MSYRVIQANALDMRFLCHVGTSLRFYKLRRTSVKSRREIEIYSSKLDNGAELRAQANCHLNYYVYLDSIIGLKLIVRYNILRVYMLYHFLDKLVDE